MTPTALDFILFAAFLAFSTLDGVLTHTILSRGGFEANPLIAFAYERAGVYGLAAVKVAIGGFVAYLSLAGTLPAWGVCICIALYGITVLHLRREIRKLDARDALKPTTL